MEYEDELHDISELPEPEPGNTVVDLHDLYLKADQLLNDLSHHLHLAYNGRENPWPSRVHAVRPKEAQKEHIIGIIGATGAGKSALINALLDMDRLVPTSCMQACTATIIEIAYNQCAIHDYRSTIEFVTREKWQGELETFFKYFVNASEEDLEDETSAAAIAYAKIAAIYPQLSRHYLSTCTAEDLMARSGLEILGTTLDANASTSHELYDQLQKYVESKEKSQASIKGLQTESHNVSNEMEYWPLVEKVRIYTKSPILKTGCVLVDLPGTFDVNAARAATAKAYLAKCSSVWIVVPISRAVDDKVGQSLLDESLKYQLRRDGALGRVVMICSKADQCFVHELRGKLRNDTTLQGALKEINTRKEKMTKQKTNASSDVKKEDKRVKDTSNSIANLEAELDTYGKLLEMAKNGKVVYPPIVQTAKRQITTRACAPRKQARLRNATSSNSPPKTSGIGNKQAHSSFSTELKSPEIGTCEIKQDHTKPPLGVAELQLKVHAITRALGELRHDLATHNENLRAANFKLEELREDGFAITDDEWYAYYSARNKQVVTQLQADFRSGIKELEHTEREASDDVIRPSGAETREEQQSDLQVFCVASHGYQKMRGRFEDETFSGKFKQIDETGIPELMRMSIDIGERHIQARRKIFADDVRQLLNSVLWLLPSQKAGHDDVSVVLPQGSQTIEDITKTLHKDLTDSFRRLTMNIDAQFHCVIDVLMQAAQTGEGQALDIVRAWGAPTYSQIPGLHHATYRAVLRRGGVHPKRNQPINWIEELLGPMIRTLDVHWIQAFRKAIPIHLKDAVDECTQLIDRYLIDLIQQYEFFCVPRQERKMFKEQFESLRASLDDSLNATGESIDESVKLANRVCEETVSPLLSKLFYKLADDRGKGVFDRNKSDMEKGINAIKKEMYTDAATEVINALTICQRNYRKGMWSTLEETLDARHQDCQRLFGKESQHLTDLSREHEINIIKVIRSVAELHNLEVEISEAEPIIPAETAQESLNATEVPVDDVSVPQPAQPEVQPDLPSSFEELPELRTDAVFDELLTTSETLVESQPAPQGETA